MSHKESSDSFGWHVHSPHFELHFFGRQKNLQDLKGEYSEPILSLHQTHGDSCFLVENQTQLTEPTADAHSTRLKNCWLAIKTADCLPIFIFDSKNQKLLAVHAGWRGIANCITLKSLATSGLDIKSSFIFVGPHIQKNSFVVRSDCLQEIKNGTRLETEFENFVQQLSTDQYQIDLAGLLKLQLVRAGMNSEQYVASSVDVFRDHQYWSYRREAKSAGRNISIAKLK